MVAAVAAELAALVASGEPLGLNTSLCFLLDVDEDTNRAAVAAQPHVAVPALLSLLG